LRVSRGRIVNAGGAVLVPTVTVPESASAIDVDLEGEVFAVRPQGRTLVGRIVLALFADPSSLRRDDGLFYSAERPKLGNPGDDTNGVIRTAGVARAETVSQAADTQPKGRVVGHSATVEIAINAGSEIEGEDVLLGEIAKIDADKATAKKLAAVEIGPTPPIGVKIPLDLLRVTALLRAALIDPANFTFDVPRGAYYARKSSHVAQQQFIDCAIEFAKTQSDPGMEFSCKQQDPEFLAPLGKLELKVEQYSPTMNGATVIVGVYVDDKRQNGRSLRLDITGFNNKPIIRVPASTTVKLILRCNGAVVETQAKTIQAGVVGQVVEVQTPDRSIHTGTLTGPTTVEVTL
jgi:hypothetical protein